MKVRIADISGIFLLAFACILLFFMSCKKQTNDNKIDAAFTGEISAVTSGTISCVSVIRIVLAEEYPGRDLNKASTTGLFRFKPRIKGHTVWVDKKTIEFRPDHKLKSAQSY